MVEGVVTELAAIVSEAVIEAVTGTISSDVGLTTTGSMIVKNKDYAWEIVFAAWWRAALCRSHSFLAGPRWRAL